MVECIVWQSYNSMSRLHIYPVKQTSRAFIRLFQSSLIYWWKVCENSSLTTLFFWKRNQFSQLTFLAAVLKAFLCLISGFLAFNLLISSLHRQRVEDLLKHEIVLVIKTESQIMNTHLINLLYTKGVRDFFPTAA